MTVKSSQVFPPLVSVFVKAYRKTNFGCGRLRFRANDLFQQIAASVVLSWISVMSIFPFSVVLTILTWSLLFRVYVIFLSKFTWHEWMCWCALQTVPELEQVHQLALLQRSEPPLYPQLVLQLHPPIPQTNTITACIFITSLLQTFSCETFSLISNHSPVSFRCLLLRHFNISMSLPSSSQEATNYPPRIQHPSGVWGRR